MKLLLFLIFITFGEAAYITYSYQQQTAAGFLNQESAWQDKADALQGENKQLTDTKNGLAQNIGAVQSQISLMNQKLGRSDTGPGDAPVVENKEPIPALNSNLGTITTLAGKSFQNCQLLKIEKDGITFNHSEGITKVLFSDLPLDVQRQFHADPQSQASMEAARLRYEEQVRQAGGNPGTTPATTSTQ